MKGSVVSEKYEVEFKSSVNITDLYEIKERPRRSGEKMFFTKEQLSRSQQLRNAIRMGIAILHGAKLEDLEKTMRSRVIPRARSKNSPQIPPPIEGTPIPSPDLAAVIPSQEIPEGEIAPPKRAVVYHDEVKPMIETALKFHEKRILQIVTQSFSRKSVVAAPRPSTPVAPPSPEPESPSSEESDVPQESKPRAKAKTKKKKQRVKKSKVIQTPPVSQRKVGKPEPYNSSGGGGQSEDHKKPAPLKPRPKVGSKVKGGAGMFIH